MFEQFDFDTLGKVSNKAVKDKAREIGFAEVVAVLTEHFGADFVSVVGSAEVAIGIGSRTVADGTCPEVPLVLKLTAKEFEGHMSTGKTPAWVEPYDRFEAAQDFADEVAAKEADKAAKAEAKAKAIAKAEADRKAKAAAKAAKKGAE